jgi:amidase
MTELQFQSATQMVRAILDRRISAVELLDYHKERIRRFNPGVNAIVSTDFDSAQQRAKAADKALANGDIWGPLHGLPMTVKDSIEVKGMPCTSGFPG